MGYRSRKAAIGDISLARTQLPDCPHLATSEGRKWGDVRLDEYGPFHAAKAEPMPPRAYHVVLIARDHSSYVFQKRFGENFESSLKPGDMAMVPAGHETTYRGRLPSHLRIGLTVDIVTEAVEDLGRAGAYTHPNLSNVFRIQDQFIGRLGDIFSSELLRPAHPAQDVLVESASMALSVHLLRSYGVSTEVHGGFSGGNVAAIRRALEFMSQPLDTRISLSDVAAASGISRFHLSRIFKKQLGVSPIAYLERVRIERAMDLIQRDEMSLAEVAQTVGFADQSHFTRRFKHYVGQTPGAYARDQGRRPLMSQLGAIHTAAFGGAVLTQK